MHNFQNANETRSPRDEGMEGIIPFFPQASFRTADQMRSVGNNGAVT